MPRGGYDPEYFARMRATFEGFTYVLISRTKQRAKRKGISFDLDLEWLREEIIRQEYCCARTGLEFVYDTQYSPWQPSIDRIDGTGGYTRDNVQIVCLMYNLTKNSASDDEVLVFAEALVSNEF